MTKIKCFMRDESMAHPGKWRIIPVHDNLKISSLFKHSSLYIPKDEYMRGSKMFDNLHLETKAVFHDDTGICSPAYNGVRKW